MLTEVRIRGHKLFHRNMWKVSINREKWLYLSKPEMFVDEHGRVASKENMPLDVQLGFAIAWERNPCALNERYSRRRSYGWKLLISNLQMEGRDIVVVSRGRHMGLLLLDEPENPLKSIPIYPVPACRVK